MEAARQRPPTRHCAWCGRPLVESGKAGRKRLYCAQACRQRAYERRSSVERGGLPADAVVFSAGELADFQDRLFQVRCAAEDVVTAVTEGASKQELRALAADVAELTKGLERLRKA